MIQEHIKAVIIDDDPLHRQGILHQLNAVDDIALVGIGTVGDHLFELVEQHQPDIIILDLNMPQRQGSKNYDFKALPAIARVNEMYPGTLIIVISQYISLTLIRGAFETGIRGYILKDDDEAIFEIADAVRQVKRGQPVLSNAIRQEMFKSRYPTDLVEFTKQQTKVMRQLASDLDASYQYHADALGIAEKTFRNHLSEINRKLGTTNKTASVVRCMELGIIPFNSRYIE